MGEKAGVLLPLAKSVREATPCAPPDAPVPSTGVNPYVRTLIATGPQPGLILHMPSVRASVKWQKGHEAQVLPPPKQSVSPPRRSTYNALRWGGIVTP